MSPPPYRIAYPPAVLVRPAWWAARLVAVLSWRPWTWRWRGVRRFLGGTWVHIGCARGFPGDDDVDYWYRLDAPDAWCRRDDRCCYEDWGPPR